MNKIKLALVDDHIMLRNGLAGLLTEMGFQVVFEANNGKDMTTLIKTDDPPDIVLMDIQMPVIDGYAAAAWLRDYYPLVKVIALSMYDNELSIIRMLRNGARGYIVKDADPAYLVTAIDNLVKTGYHYSEQVTGKILHSVLHGGSGKEAAVELNERELEFLKLVVTEMTYREIAALMHLSPRTIDGYRDQLFEKLNVKTRVGLAVYAIRNNVVILK